MSPKDDVITSITAQRCEKQGAQISVPPPNPQKPLHFFRYAQKAKK